MNGKSILKVASEHIGSSYVLGARAVLSNSNHKGPWDCAEYTSWCAYQTYGIVFGTYGSDPNSADAYSGKWYEDAKKAGTLVSVGEALATPGAFVVRKPGDFNTKIGHVAICIGDSRLYEARSAKHGVVVSTDAVERNWTSGLQLPGVLYVPGTPINYAKPERILQIQHPFIQGDVVLTLQCALERAGYSVGGLDGVFGGKTEAAVTNLQLAYGLTTDGQVGPETAKALEIGWPIDESLKAILCQGIGEIQSVEDDSIDSADELRGTPEDESANAVLSTAADLTIQASGRDYWAAHGTSKFFIGTKVKYGSYWGLYQKIQDLPKLGGGVFDPDEAESAIGSWAHVLHPTILGESSGYFGRLNTYDRARFTFGCFQMAAHTAGDNLILLFRELIKLPNAARYFPDLELSGGRVHRRVNGALVSLEREEYSQKHKETQLPDFMAYLNPTLSDVEDDEALAAARLMLWTTEDRSARLLQVELAKATIIKKIGFADAKGLDIMNLPLPLAIWCMDLRHQGRAKISTILTALAKPNPYEALKWAGSSHNHKSRVETVDKAIKTLLADKPAWSQMTLSQVVN